MITDLGVYDFATPDREMRLVSLHPGVTREQVLENLGWEVAIADPLGTTEPPSERELSVIRELDPDRLHLG